MSVIFVCYDILAESLPACRYWIRQNGETEEMFDNQYITVKKMLADVIVVKRNNSEDIVVCKQAGYTQYEYNPQSIMLVFLKQ